MKQKKPKKPLDPITFAKLQLRRGSVRWYARNECIKRARVDRGKYQCNICKGIFPLNQIERDHIKTVVNIKNAETSLDEYALNLYSPPENWQALCINCHDQKTRLENEMRKFYRKERAKEKRQKK